METMHVQFLAMVVSPFEGAKTWFESSQIRQSEGSFSKAGGQWPIFLGGPNNIAPSNAYLIRESH